MELGLSEGPCCIQIGDESENILTTLIQGQCGKIGTVHSFLVNNIENKEAKFQYLSYTTYDTRENVRM